MAREPDKAADFVQSEGVPFLAHLLRRLSDRLVDGFSDWYPQYGVLAPVRTASTMRLLYRRGGLPVTVIAQEIHQSHPLAISWIKQLSQLGLVSAARDPSDGRKSIITLTQTGRKDVERMLKADAIILAAYEDLFCEADADVFEALWRLEAACRRQGMGDRLRAAQQKTRR
ncbi:MarR family transcriptional regulator [Brevundimonas sp. S30B]|uniref:MarR family winged helix-turn-helix transcriptional regulator n=1 Tax=unclassified Brevundimonas TaxID=2622653 RepID=UPI0010727EDB|nr:MULTISPECIES: MarR family transcriptional regulator [unclassified Brevundimonas]QBX38084.1 MarR family transcriptional regulator [Brevundimonas sp. MF30-B]TFW02562.1 MarR family transcriptional regulator [Brevundimonas sp. S30B]